MANKDKFPLTVKTDFRILLLQSFQRFGIIELKDATLPVTLRNLEPEVRTRTRKIDKQKKGIIEKVKEGLLDKAVKIGESLSSILPRR